ncbi:MAG: AEC family transporter, partial [Desulfurobacteriaceae bacterium]
STVMNAGYMGIPLIYLMFGEKVVSFATFYMVVMAIFHFTLGIVILERENLKEGIISAFKIPLVHAAVFAFLTKDFVLPSGIEKIIKIAGEATLPLMLVSIGISLSRIKLNDVVLSFVGTGVRFFGGTLSALFLVKLFSCSPLLSKVLIVQSSLPSAILNYVLCERFSRSPEVAASIIFISTLLFPIYLLFLKTII